MKKFLVISEVSKKQGYIFKTNKLKENIGASNIIEYITEDLPKKKLMDVLGIKNSTDSKKDPLQNYKVSVGGGNSLFMVDKEKDAKEFIKSTTTEVIKKFPGIEFFMAYHEFDYEKDSIIDAIDKIYKKLNDKKSARKSIFRRKSYGIEQECVKTGLPAFERDNGEYISKESTLKRDCADYPISKGSTINKIVKDYENKGYFLPKELEDMITEKGDNSYIAIVTLDGNKMGQKIESMKDKAKKVEEIATDMKSSNEKYIDKLMDFSGSIKDYYEEAFRNMLDEIDKKYEKVEKELKLEERNKGLKGKNKKIMPVRPIILAGDDVCFICNAKIALECVNLFISSLNKYEVEGEQLNACAGICMLKSKYPFDKGYEIAEHLCANGKAKIVDSNDASLVDFHICQGEISTSINEIRSRALINKDIELNIKPLYISITKATKKDKEDNKRIIEKEYTFNTYDNFKVEFEKIKNMATESKGKVRKLRDIFPQGEDKTRIFMNKNMIASNFESGFGLKKGDVKNGFATINKKSTCLYFDIIELQDMFIKLDD
ncbi:Cas10/Cmr2 second palm domain-containing protein [Intestinibacter sp.]